MKKILSLILAICLILTMAPVVIYADEPTLGEATLVGDYSFTSDFLASDLGKMVVSDLTKENDAYTVSYPEEGGVKLTRNSVVSEDNTAKSRLSFNFIKEIDKDKGIYQQGVAGVYAIDLTFKTDFTVPTGNTGRCDLYLSNSIDNASGNTTNNFRMIPKDKQFTKVESTTYKFSNRFSNEYTTYRIVVDTINDKMYGYDLKNGSFTFTWEGTYTLDTIASFTVAFRDKQLAEGSYIHFKDIAVYEFENSVEDFVNTYAQSFPESFEYVKGGAVDTTSVTDSIALPASWANYTVASSDTSVLKADGTVTRAAEDKEVTLTVTAKQSGVILTNTFDFVVKAAEEPPVDPGEPPVDPDVPPVDPDVPPVGPEEPPVEPEIPDDPKLGGTLLFDYNLTKEFAETELGKQVIVDKVAACGFDYQTIYTDEGITLVKNFGPLYTNDAQTSGESTDALGFNLAALVSDNAEDGTRMYKTGFSGVYALEFTINVSRSDAWKAGTNKASGRADIYVTDNASTFNLTGAPNIRFTYKSSSFTANMDSTAITTLGSLTFDKDETVRVVVDTVNDEVCFYTKEADGKYSEHIGVGKLALNSIGYVWYRARSFCEQGDSVTFKNIKLYEISKDETAQGEVYYTNTSGVLVDKFMDVDGNEAKNSEIRTSLVFPHEFASLNVETSEKKLLTTTGKVTRNNYEDKNVTLSVSGSSYGVFFKKIYDFVIKARDDIDKKDIATYNYASADDLIYTGDNNVTAKGFEVVNKSYADGTTIGLLKSEKSADSNSKTYIYDYSGAYDFELDVIPGITQGKATVEIGNYDADTGVFEGFGKLNVDSDGVKYADIYDDVLIVGTAEEYKLKFRADTADKALWVWANGATSSEYGYEYKSDKTLNAYRVSFENAGENDTLTLKNATFTQLVYAKTDAVVNTATIADSITVNSLVANPSDAYGNINLPEFKGYNVKWSTDNDLADLENKKIYRSFTDEDITITALISSASNPEVKVRKDFYLKVKGTTDASEILNGALAKITAESVTGQKRVVADLKLPSTTAEGYTVTWESLSEGYISHEGVINKSINIANDTKVTFKVTVSSNGASLSKNITFTLAKRGADVVVAPSDITVSAEGVVTYKATVSGNGNAYLKDSEGNNIVGFAVNNGKVSFDCKNTDNAQYNVGNTFEIAVVMNYADRCASILVDGKVLADSLPYIIAGDGFKNVVSSGLTLSNEKVVFDEYSLFAYNRKVFGYMDAFDNEFVAGNRDLKTNAIGGVIVNWTTSDNTVIKNNGVYTAPVNIAFVDVTLTMKMVSGSGATYTETKTVAAVPSEDRNLMVDAIVSSDLKEDVSHGKIKLYDNDLTSYFGADSVKDKNYIIIELDDVKEINALYFFQKQGEGIDSCDIYLSNDGESWRFATSAVFSDIRSNMAVFDYQNAKYIKITNIAANNDDFKLYELKAYLSYTADNKAAFDIEALNMPAEYKLKATSLDLPTVGSVYGSKLTWTSSKPDVISTTGKVNKPSVATEVVLTVVAEFEGTTATKKFTYLVSGSSAGGAGGSGGGGGSAGSISGVNTGGASISATPTTPEVELEKVEVPKVEKGMFTDTPKDAWYYTYLTDLVEKGVVNGYADGSFGPNNKVTREEFLKMLIVATNIEVTDKTFELSDVKAEDWFAPYVYTAKDKGISNGISDTEFGAGMPISRQDMAVMIYNITETGFVLSDDAGMFADHSSINLYAINAVYAMKKFNVINGYEDGEFKPAGNLTRAEAVKVISLIMKMQ